MRVGAVTRSPQQPPVTTSASGALSVKVHRPSPDHHSVTNNDSPDDESRSSQDDAADVSGTVTGAASDRTTVSVVGWRKRHEGDWLDCQSPAWQEGYEDGYAAREPDRTRDGRSHWRPSPAQRNYVDGFVTGQTEREIDEREIEG